MVKLKGELFCVHQTPSPELFWVHQTPSPNGGVWRGVGGISPPTTIVRGSRGEVTINGSPTSGGMGATPLEGFFGKMTYK